MKEIDLEKIQELLFQLVSDTISNNISYEEVELVKLELPTQMIEIFQHLSEVTEEPCDDIIADYATAGIMTQLQELIASPMGKMGLGNPAEKNKGGNLTQKAGENPNELNADKLFKELGINTDELKGMLNKLNSLASSLDPNYKPEEE